MQQEVKKMNYHRQELYEAIKNIPDAYVERVLKMISVWTEPMTHQEEVYEWKKNLATEPYDLSEEEKDQMNCKEFVAWEDVKKQIESDES